jgi:hypothetical protein
MVAVRPGSLRGAVWCPPSPVVCYEAAEDAVRLSAGYQAEQFEVDGSLRDVCVLGTDVSVWERLMAAVPGVPGEYGFSVDGEPVALADFSVRRFFAEDPRESSPQLDLRLGELRFACFFFEPTEIEFSFGPEDLEGGWYLAAWPTRQQHCGNIQVLTGPTGYPEWVSEVEPGSTHDIAARPRTRTARRCTRPPPRACRP